MFTRAIVRPPAANFSEGLTTANLGAPDYERALKQHDAYCLALERCGLALTKLEPDPSYPDSTFVEDAAIVAAHCAVMTRPGAPSRLGEITSLRDVLSNYFPSLLQIVEPGTLDGGDVCEAGNHFFVGISERTNEAGAQQLAELVAQLGYTSTIIDIRDLRARAFVPVLSEQDEPATGSILHLKSGLAYLGDNRLVVVDALADRAEFSGYDLVRVDSDGEYAANCVRVNDYVLVAAGYPKVEAKLQELGSETVTLEMSEFQKMDGGLSCLSLRF
jgi:dimethylargininase